MNELTNLACRLLTLVTSIEPNTWTAIATVALVVATLLLAFIAWRQIKTTQRQLRAYITVRGVDAAVQPGRFVFTIVISNSGQTPAYDLRIDSHTRILPFPLPQTTKFVISPAANPSAGTLGPNREVTSDGVFSGTNGEIAAALQQGASSRFYTYGTVRYRDAFKKRHFTNFCFHIQRDASGSTLSALASEHHNEAN